MIKYNLYMLCVYIGQTSQTNLKSPFGTAQRKHTQFEKKTKTWLH